MSKPLISIIGKTIRHIARIRGGGSALPGLVVERIDPNFIKDTLSKLPMGVIVVSGTNGKTTTTKIVVELLEGQGLKVFTNRTGSNFTRGIAAALVSEVDIYGNIHADIAVLELDEAYAVHFVNKIQPEYSLLLNVMRDQLDRFGEIDKTAKMLEHVAKSTTGTVILNREDELVSEIAKSLTSQKVSFFGLDKKLLSTFPSDKNLHSKQFDKNNDIKADVILSDVSKDQASFIFNDQLLQTKIKLTGIYNIFNAAAALALVNSVLKNKVDQLKLINSLSKVTPAFGRGETLIYKNQPIELILVKNPSGFILGLKSFDPSNYATMISINDNYADGRDMSWLWDVDFSSLKNNGVDQVSGSRAFDMAIRLHYDDIKINNVDTDIKKSLKAFIKNNSDKPKRIYCTYTSMLKIRRILSKITKVEDIK